MLEVWKDYNNLQYTMVLQHMQNEIRLSISLNCVYGLGWKLLVYESINCLIVRHWWSLEHTGMEVKKLHIVR